MYFIWKDAYRMDIAEIDKQHQRMFEIGGGISDLVLNDTYNQEELKKIFIQLEDYTCYHFRCEEILMEKCNFPEQGAHKIEHQLFVKKLQRIRDQYQNSKLQETMIELITFISGWITGHIMKSDMRYKSFLESQNHG